MRTIALTANDQKGFNNFYEYCKKWSSEHQAEIGVAEMALGAGLLSWGVSSGHVIIGHDVTGSALSDIGAIIGSVTGGIGSYAIATMFLKGLCAVGIAGVAGVTAIPAIAIIGAGTLVFSSFGYVVGEVIQRFMSPDFADLLLSGSLLAVGVALMFDGARRIVNDDRVLVAASKFKDGMIKLMPEATDIVIKSWEELRKELEQNPQSGLVAGATTTAGTLIGGSLAAGSVTVLGSHGLGAAALSLGLVSAPVWPIFVGGAVGLALAYPTWKAVKYVYDRAK